NLERLKQTNGRVVASDAWSALERETGPFDLVFLDPPFADDAWSEAARRLELRGLLAPQAFVYVETTADAQPELPADWHPHREGRAGGVRHVLYRRAGGIR
ncbi:MAG TPA: RsmD family RNA methyltransferase, partial [Tahibacter sp.]|nr:RsmD family RNA methyltransferase [Tahibacter sp.]